MVLQLEMSYYNINNFTVYIFCTMTMPEGNLQAELRVGWGHALRHGPTLSGLWSVTLMQSS